MEKILSLLLKYQEKEYGDFSSKLSPNLPRDYFLGVRVPNIRKIVKTISMEDKLLFINELHHTYFEENQLHGFILQSLKDYNFVIDKINEFLPFANSWAITDCMVPKIFSKNKSLVLDEVKKWLKSSHTYTIRFGVNVLMELYLSEDFDVNHFNLINEINSSEYYVNMMIAWYYATALFKRWDDTIKLIESKTLSKWIQNKTIQKAIESYRITNEQKEYLRKLKIS